jgi:4-hydroxybutyrate dehydrogenase
MARITYLTGIEFEPGALATLPATLNELGVKRPLLIADKGVIAAGLAGRAQALMAADTPVFDGTPSNPTEEAVLEGRRRRRGPWRWLAHRSCQGRGAARDT